MATTKKQAGRSVAPYYGVAATWVVYALLFDLYKVRHYLVVIVLSAAVGLLLNAVCGEETAAEPEKAKEPEKPKEESTGNAELDKMIKDGRLAIAEMKRLDENIEDEKISADIRKLELVSQKIFDQVKADPAKLSQIRRFMDYYLPTIIKLLDAYAGFEDQNVDGENIRASKENIERMTETLSVAFEKQFDSLFLTETMDINAEIRTMDSLLRQDGYIGGMEMKKAADH